MMATTTNDVKADRRCVAGPAAAAPVGPVLAIDIGATWTRAAVVLLTGEVVARQAGPTPFDGTRRELGDAVVRVAELAHAAAVAAGTTPVAVGVAAIGPLDARAGRLLGPPNVGPGYRDLDLATPLQRRFDLPLYLERDTNVAALGERAFGAARGVDDFVYLTISTGVGGAIVSHGRLFLGATGFAGELGHIPVALDGPACGCGGVGHFEALSSGTGIARAAREAGLTPPAGAGVLTAAGVAGAERAGDARAAAVMTRARQAFAAAVVGIVNAFNPRLIVVGGGVARAEGDRLFGPAREAIAAQALAPAAAAVELVPAALGDDVSLVGCLPLVNGGGQPIAAALDRVS
jgi:glucokinase